VANSCSLLNIDVTFSPNTSLFDPTARRLMPSPLRDEFDSVAVLHGLGRFSSYAAADDGSSPMLVDVGARLGPHINNKRRSIADQARERVLRQEVSWRITTRNDGGTRARISNRQGSQVLHAPFHVAGDLSPSAGISFGQQSSGFSRGIGDVVALGRATLRRCRADFGADAWQSSGRPLQHP